MVASLFLPNGGTEPLFTQFTACNTARMDAPSGDAANREKSASGRPPGLTILVVAAVVIVAAIAAAAIIAAAGGEPAFDPGSPDAALQHYLDAIIDGDVVEAHGSLSEELRSQCSTADLRNGAYQAEGVRVILDSRTVHDDVAAFAVTISSNDGGGLFGEGYRYEEFFTLTNTADGWVLSERPWPIFFCSEEP